MNITKFYNALIIIQKIILKKSPKKIDKEQNSEGETFKYLMTFDTFDEYTIKKDNYFGKQL